MTKSSFRHWPAAVLLAGMLSLSPALATYSGLVVIPTTDVVGDKQYSIEELQTDGNFSGLTADTYLVNTEFGIGERFETGIDFDIADEADSRVFLNAKYIVARSADARRALAVGVFNCAENVDSTPYLVGSQRVGAGNLNMGMMHLEGHLRPFIGLDRALTDRISVMADYTHGDDNYSSTGINYQASDALSVMVGALFPNMGGATRFSVHMVLSGSYAQ